MDNVRKMEEFLKLIAGASKNGYSVDPDTVYHNLIYLGLENKQADISSNFERWIQRFANKKNINVFVSPNWKYFCQFVNWGKKPMSTYSAIKLYIPLDKDHVYEGANIIFDYLNKENIRHVSKIGKKVRFDNIVIRVDNVRDANKIIEFINKEPYIREGFTTKNPFTIQDGMVSMAWDGMLSYNTVVSTWISQYIEWEKQNNGLDKVSFSRFFAFVQKRKSDVFEQGKDINEFADWLMEYDTFPRDSKDDGMLEARLVNYYDVTNLMLMSITPGMKKEDLYNYINLVTSDRHQKVQIDRIGNLLNGNQSLSNSEKETEEVVLYTPQQKAAYILAFKYMCEKYGYSNTRESFLAYAYDGMHNRITSYKGARNLIITNGITKEIARGISKEIYDTNLIIESTLNFALLETYKKYGSAQVYEALKRLLEKKDFIAISNNKSGRVLLRNSMKSLETPLDVQHCLMGIMSVYGDEFSFENIDEICAQYCLHFNEKVIKRKR